MNLEELGLADNTVIIFTSDNGPENISLDKGTYGSTGGLRGRKRSLFEGGIRVPFIVKWPGITPEDKTNTSLLSSADILPTLLNIAQVALPEDFEPDGVDAYEAFLNKDFIRDKPIMWEWRFPTEEEDFWPMLAIRNHEFALFTNPIQDKLELHNMLKDRDQAINIENEHKEVVHELNDQLEQWDQLLPGYKNRPGVH